jgi:hypothetical protein
VRGARGERECAPSAAAAAFVLFFFGWRAPALCNALSTHTQTHYRLLSTYHQRARTHSKRTQTETTQNRQLRWRSKKSPLLLPLLLLLPPPRPLSSARRRRGGASCGSSTTWRTRRARKSGSGRRARSSRLRGPVGRSKGKSEEEETRPPRRRTPSPRACPGASPRACVCACCSARTTGWGRRRCCRC